VTTTATYNDGAWHHVAATVGNDGMKLYLDGALAGSNAATGVQSITGYWHAGCGKYTGYTGAPTSSWLNGELDDVAIHPTQLSAEAVRWHYLSGLVIRPAPIDGSATIATIIGTATASSTGDGGAATSATINTPYAAIGDVSGNIYVAESNGCRVRKIAPTGTVTTYAGNGTCTSTGDGGAATSATLNYVTGLAVAPDGSVYIVEGNGNRVRKVSTAGTISTFAGTGTASSTGDGGAATAATINSPRGITVDHAGSVYISESAGNRVRKVTSAGTISTIMGTGTASSSGDGGAATSATVNGPRNVAVARDGSIYISDAGGCRIRKISAAGIASTVVGTGTCTSTGDSGAATSATINNPRGVVLDEVGNLYVAELDGARVRRVDAAGVITTISGNGTASSTGDGGAASSATLFGPYGLAFDQAGRLLVVEEGNGSGTKVRRIG
jgi:trimeric autotransporter adhesin